MEKRTYAESYQHHPGVNIVKLTRDKSSYHYDLGLTYDSGVPVDDECDSTVLSLLRSNIAREFSISRHTLKNATQIYDDVGSLNFVIRVSTTRKSSTIHTTLCRVILETLDNYLTHRPKLLLKLLETYPRYI